MSNEFKEWKEERKEDAWDDIIKIANFLSFDDKDEIDKLEYVYTVLREGGWF